MRDFSPSELNHSLDAIPFLQESDGVFFLEVVVMIIRIGPELQFLHLDDVLLLFGLVLFLFLLVLPLAVIHRFGDGRFGRWCDED